MEKINKKTVGVKIYEMIELTPEIKKMLKIFSSWRGLTIHHVDPKERGGKNGNGNRKHIAGKYHSLLHLFFGNMTIEEMKFFLEFWLKGKKRTWKEKDILKLQQLVVEGKIEEAIKLSQFGYKQQCRLAESLFDIVESKKIRKLKRKINSLQGILDKRQQK